MKIYLGARYSRLAELNAYKRTLESHGHTVTSRWLLGEHQAHDGALEIEAASDSMPLIARAFAQDDVEDVQAADVFICFTEAPRSGQSRGGRHVEFGLALAWRKAIIVIGPRENIFYTLPEVEHYPDWLAFWSQWSTH